MIVSEFGGAAMYGFRDRVRCHNNKGVVDEYRRPKEAYDVVKEYYPMMGNREK